MVRRLAVLLAVLSALPLGATGALAGPNGAFTITETAQNVTETFVDVLPCAGAGLYTITVTYNIVEHATFSPNGSVHFTFTQTGTFMAVPADASQPTVTGRFTFWGGFNGNNSAAAGTFTGSIRGTATDGSRVNFHVVEHFNVSASGIANEFVKARCA